MVINLPTLEICLSNCNLSSRKYFFYALLICSFIFATPNDIFAQKEVKPLPPLSFDKGQLIYSPDSSGNRIPDFSYCGYKASEQPIPDLPVKVTVPLSKGDATQRIQSAIDY